MTINPRRGTTMTKSEDGGAARNDDRAARGRRELAFHLDRLNAWLVELWAAKSIDLHMCNGTRRENKFGLLRDIRDDVMALRDALPALAPAAAPVEPQGVEPVGWQPLTMKNDLMTCPLPADETVVEVMLDDGAVCDAWYSCNIMEAGDWDFMPIKEDGEPDDDADSIASRVVAWRNPPATPPASATPHEPQGVEPVAWAFDELHVGFGGERNWHRRVAFDKPVDGRPDIRSVRPLFYATPPASAAQAALTDAAEKIDLSALNAWFPDGVPLVAVKVMFPEKSAPLTTAEVRHVMAALAAASLGAQGWRLVPEEPTPEIDLAIYRANGCSLNYPASQIYKAALAAAPTAPVNQREGADRG